MTDHQKRQFADDEFLTRADVCDRLKISRKTLWEWTRDGIAPPTVKIGGTVRYPKSLLEKFLEGRVQAGNLQMRSSLRMMIMNGW